MQKTVTTTAAAYAGTEPNRRVVSDAPAGGSASSTIGRRSGQGYPFGGTGPDGPIRGVRGPRQGRPGLGVGDVRPGPQDDPARRGGAVRQPVRPTGDPGRPRPPPAGRVGHGRVDGPSRDGAGGSGDARLRGRPGRSG